ncbi:bifunctional lysylphosphatidylglycerol flippase/synthetase MprF [Arthrobacter sp. HLT1-20]
MTESSTPGTPAPDAIPQPPSPLRLATGRYLRKSPVSMALAVLTLLAATAAGTLWKFPPPGQDAPWWAAGVSNTVGEGLWWTPLTALFVAENPAQLAVVVLLSLSALAAAERLVGSRRTALAFVVTGAVGITLGIALQWLGASAGELWAQYTQEIFTGDPTIGIVGALVTASAFAPTLWRRRIRLFTFATVLMFVLYNGDQNNFYRLMAGLLGLLLGSMLRPGPFFLGLRRSSHAETRSLVAAVVAISALGPLAALLPPGGSGPLSFVSLFFGASLDGSRGLGQVLLALLPLVLLLVAAGGLRRGRRFALILAIAANAAVAVLPFTAPSTDDLDLTLDGTEPTAGDVLAIGELLVGLAAALLLPLALIVLLLITRRQFQIRAPRRSVRRFALTVAGSFVVLALVYLVAAVTIPGGVAPGAVLASTLQRFIPEGLQPILGTVAEPTAPLVLFLFQWVGPVFWTVFVLAALKLLRATETGRSVHDEQRFRELLQRGGGGTLSFMGTWKGNVYWFSDDGQSGVAYRLINGIAIVLSDPVALDHRIDPTIREFIAFCDANSWVPVFYSVHGRTLPTFAALDFSTMPVGEETLMHPPTFDLAGKHWQKVRSASNRGTREGVTTLWSSWAELPALMASRINTISEQWVAEKELPEMGFTLGGMDELKDPEVKLLLAIGKDGSLQAITSWLPSYRDGKAVGYTLDFMRRGEDAIPGIMEFVIAAAAFRMKDDGVEVLSLSGAPLATKPLADGQEPDVPTAMTLLLDTLASTLEPAYGFHSLFKFKSKFNPEYQTMHMAFTDPLKLPAIGVAIGKAYLPDIGPKDYPALARTLAK